MSERYPESPAAPPAPRPATAAGRPAGGPEPSTTNNGGASDRAKQSAQTGKQAAGDVAQTAADKGQDVAREAKTQARNVLGQAQDQLREQAGAQHRSLVDNLHALADELAAMADGSDRSGPATDLVAEAGSRAHSAASWLGDREPGELVDELRRFARRRPGAFIVGALASGVLAGRLTRGVVDVHRDDDDDDASAAGAEPAVGRRSPDAALAPHQPPAGRAAMTEPAAADGLAGPGGGVPDRRGPVMTGARADSGASSIGERQRERVGGSDDIRDVSVGQLIGDVSRDISTLMRQEVELAKAEVKAEVAKAGKGAGMLGGAGFAGYMVLLFLSCAGWWGLANVMDAAYAALIVAAVWLVIGATMFVVGRSTLRAVNPKPERTIDTANDIPSALKGD